MKHVNIFSFSFKGLRLLTILSFGGLSQVFATTHTINFAGTSFTPNTLNVAVGDTIVWKGAFGFHVIENTHGAIPNGAATFGPSKSTDASLVYVVTVSGHYDYQCNTHVSMGMIGSFTAAASGVDDAISNDVATLEKNFPNPFGASTTIRYSLSRPSNVTLTVYDINGKEVKKLAAAYRNAGSYEISFDASALPSGAYTYQLQEGEAVLRRQMIIAH